MSCQPTGYLVPDGMTTRGLLGSCQRIEKTESRRWKRVSLTQIAEEFGNNVSSPGHPALVKRMYRSFTLLIILALSLLPSPVVHAQFPFYDYHLYRYVTLLNFPMLLS